MTDELERRVAALEQAFAALTRPDRSDPADPAAEDDRFWLLQQVRDRHPDGAVVFGGTATLPEGEVAWQWGVPSDQVLEQDWEPAAGVFGALAHPVRLQLAAAGAERDDLHRRAGRGRGPGHHRSVAPPPARAGRRPGG